MTDILFSTIQKLPPEWRILHRSGQYQLAALDGASPHVLHVIKRKHTLIAYLSHLDQPQDIRHFKEIDFARHLGATSGILWHTQSDEYCIFRDAFGFIPWLSTPERRIFTTNPDYHALIHTHSALNEAWFSQFLQYNTDMGQADIYEGSERILPGQSHYWIFGSCEDFLTDFVEDNPRAPRYNQTKRVNLWEMQSWEPLTDARSSIAEGLRHELIEAAARIPAENLCFTLSGGLDSTGILAAWLQSHPGPADAVTLISQAHQSCDESQEMDILEKAFSIHLTRLTMDDSWPLSQPQLYRACKGYGPLCSPGIESTVNMNRAIEDALGPRTIITGHGGNYIVKVRPEALWQHLFKHPKWSCIVKELKAVHQNYATLRRILGNLANGRIKRLYHALSPQKPKDYNDPERWLQIDFCKKHPQETVDPIFFMSHIEERAKLFQTWEWESNVRALDTVARQTNHHFYDPLFDFDLYVYCARIPPQYFLEGGEYRPIYKEALAPLLPPEIIAHPKCQSFDDLMHDGLANYGKPLILSSIEALPKGPLKNILNAHGLNASYEEYCDAVCRGDTDVPLFGLWRAISTALWCAE
ncbi:MAG: hypothetical protein J6A01_07120 [Proteobacteria bacterium]|nr:hypothetical protein [Pseudomonadota bacterium]